MTQALQRSHYVPFISELAGMVKFSTGVAYIGLGATTKIISCFERAILGRSNSVDCVNSAGNFLLVTGAIEVLNNFEPAFVGATILLSANKLYKTVFQDP